MLEIFVDDQNAPDTSTNTSTEAVDGDVSNDSIGGRLVSQWRDIFSVVKLISLSPRTE